jgi:hypothetical protein
MRSANEWRAFWRERGERELRLLLWAAWDPIDGGALPDEYRTYANRVATLLGSRASTDALAAELGRIRTTELGLEPQPDGDAHAAAKIAAWFESA